MFRFRYKLMTGIVSCSLILGSQALAAQEQSIYKDIHNHWANEQIKLLDQQGILPPLKFGEYFYPDQDITRAEFVVMLTTTLGLGPADEVGYPFVDVSQEQWYTPYLSQAKNKGLINGQADGYFHPEAPISRAEVAALIVRAFPNLPVTSSPIYFDDVYGKHWAEQDIEYATTVGVLNGYNQYTFGPKQHMTRAEAAVLTSRLLTVQQKESPLSIAAAQIDNGAIENDLEEIRESSEEVKMQPYQDESVIKYTVQSGDSLWKIAQVHGSNVEAIMQANQLDSDSLQIEQELSIPVSHWQMSLRNTLLSSEEINIANQQVENVTNQHAQVELIEWSQANNIFAINYIAKITDVYTGERFFVKRFSGANHADVEPLTSNDTRIMNRIWGEHTWNTRPIIVEVEGRKLAAAMHNMPHDVQTIKDNDFNGHTCIHFLGSTKHNNGQAWPEMQRDVQIASTHNH